MLDYIMSFLSLSWLSTIVSIVSLIVAFVLYRASMIGARPVYQKRSIGLIGTNGARLPKDIIVTHRDIKVDKLKNTRIILWNAGNKTLVGSDIVSDDPVRCELPSEKVFLEASIIKTNREVTKVGVNIDRNLPNLVFINFNYLDPNDGVVIDVLHNCDEEPIIKGTIRGVPKGILNWGSPSPFEFFEFGSRKGIDAVKYFVLIGFVVLVAGVASILVSVLANDHIVSFINKPLPDDIHIQARSLTGFLGIINVLMGSSLLWVSRRKYPTTLRIDNPPAE